MIGRSINNYRILAQIGQGGMGTVYVAQHPFMGRKAAIKVLRRAYLADEGMVALFMNEARAANAIRHPNIVDIIDVGRLEDGQPYLMMEFLEGETLADRLGRIRRLPPSDALDFISQAAEALAVAHDRGIIHRDLKPENLLLVPDLGASSGERVKVLDFGIAKLRGCARTEPSSSGLIILGSPLYLAPEQCTPDTIETDHRADIYSMGGLLYHTLCGVPPFVSDAVGGLLAMHLHDAPVAPRAIDPRIPAHVEEVILTALAKRPDDRFPSMRALAGALRAGPPGRRPPSRATGGADTLRLKARPRRRRAPLAIAVVALVVALTSWSPPRLTASLRARSSQVSAAVARMVAPWRRPRLAAPAQPPPARPIIVPLPGDDVVPPPRPAHRVSEGSLLGRAGLGNVLDRDDLWGRRN
jgi:serine/threonine protein kinase